MESVSRWSDSRSRGVEFFLIVFAAALVVRLTLLFFFHPLMIWGDEGLYFQLARSIVAGNYSEKFFLPLWPHLLAVPVAMSRDLYWGRAMCVVIGSLNVALLHRIAGRVMDSRAAFAAAVIYIFYPEQALYSHYLYAEIMLEFFILAAVAIFFDRWPLTPTPAQAALGFLFLGIGTLCKHFTVIAWCGLVVAFWPRNENIPRIRFIGAAALFFLPAFFLNLWMWKSTGDPLALINTPIKSAMESNGRKGRAFNTDDRSAIVKNLISHSLSDPIGPRVDTFKRNFENIWTPNSYSSERFQHGYYGTGVSPLAGQIIGLAHFLVMALGLVGLVAAQGGHFKKYSIVSLICLSAMSVTWLMVSRYRISEMHIFVMYTGYVLTRRIYVKNMITQGWRPYIAVGLLMALGHICFSRWNSIGSWP